MDQTPRAPLEPSRVVTWLAGSVLVVAFVAHLCGALTAWTSPNLPGHEFRQAQTAVSALFIQREGNFSLAYPTPVLGKPWSLPMEFPLYQWAVVGVSNLTGWPLVEAGRFVALLCLYLTLPATALVLRRLGMTRPQRWLALALVLACPLHVFYARAFLIETMALMLSWWFLAAFAETMHRRSVGWWLLASFAGAGAGAVKVTTFIVYLLVAAVWTAVLLHRTWFGAPRADRLRALVRQAAWSLGCVVLPIAATGAWTRFADSVKAKNPAAEFLISTNMSGFNFGYGFLDLRFKAHTWAVIAGHCLDNILSLPAVVLVAALLLFVGGRWRWIAGATLGIFAVVPVIFPMLYVLHDYYFMATAVLPMLLAGMACAALLEQRRRPWLGILAAVALAGLQFWNYSRGYYQKQLLNYAGADDLSIQVNAITQPNDVIVVAGRDWNSMLPYYSGRRALMVRGGTEYEWKLVIESFERLGGETIGAFVLVNDQRRNAGVLELAFKHLDVDPRVALVLPEASIYLTRTRVAELFQGVARYEPDGRPVLSLPPLLGQWPDLKERNVELTELHPVQRRVFAAMHPMPIRFFSAHGAGAIQRGDQQLLNTHSITRLWFALPAGAKTLRAMYGMYPGCWENVEKGTDGIEFAVSLKRPDGTTERLHSRILAPRTVAGDRGDQTIELALPPGPAGSELLLEFLPGPRNDGSFDWVYTGNVTID